MVGFGWDIISRTNAQTHTLKDFRACVSESGAKIEKQKENKEKESENNKKVLVLNGQGHFPCVLVKRDRKHLTSKPFVFLCLPAVCLAYEMSCLLLVFAL